MGRPIPIGRDRLGILGRAVGATAALVGNNAAYTIGLNDVYLSLTLRLGANRNINSTVIAWDSSGFWGLLYEKGAARFNLWTSVGGSVGLPVSGALGATIAVDIFWDRDGLAYLYVDGAFVTSASMVASVGQNLSDTRINMGGIQNTTFDYTELLSNARLFVIPAGSLPTPAQQLAIANERFLDPDHESPTLFTALGAGYPAARRLDVDFVDVEQTGTTVPNLGTGGALTIGGGFNWHQVCCTAEKVAWDQPDEDWYCLGNSYYALATANIGCALGSYIFEVVCGDVKNALNLGSSFIAYLYNAATTERIGLYYNAGIGHYLELRTNGVAWARYIKRQDYTGGYRTGHVGVLHIVYDAATGTVYYLTNGQVYATVAAATDLDLSGNVTIWLDGHGAAFAGGREAVAMRLWNYPGAAVAPPAGWRQEVYRRVQNPWSGSDLFGKTVGTGLKGEWLGKGSAQPGASTVIINQPQAGTGDIAITGATPWGTARALVRAARGI